MDFHDLQAIQDAAYKAHLDEDLQLVNLFDLQSYVPKKGAQPKYGKTEVLDDGSVRYTPGA